MILVKAEPISLSSWVILRMAFRRQYYRTCHGYGEPVSDAKGIHQLDERLS